MPMSKSHNLIDLNEKRVIQNRKIYLQGEDEENVKINSKEIMEAREFLMEKTNLLEYKDRIGVVTSYLSEERKKDKTFGIFYLIFTKALDFVLTYDKVAELREAFGERICQREMMGTRSFWIISKFRAWMFSR